MSADSRSWSEAILNAWGITDAEERLWARAILDLNWTTAPAQNPGWDVIQGRWEEIYRETASGDRLGRFGLYVTWSVLHLGWYLATREGRFHEGADLLASIFAHPQAEQTDWLDSLILRGELAYTLLQAGEEEKALAHLRVLIDEPKHKRPALREAEGALRMFLHDRDGTAMASEALTEMVREIVHRAKRRKVRRWVPQSKSYAELVELLHCTIPVKERQKAVAEFRARQQAEPR